MVEEGELMMTSTGLMMKDVLDGWMDGWMGVRRNGKMRCMHARRAREGRGDRGKGDARDGR
jgi:hypothetical protein